MHSKLINSFGSVHRKDRKMALVTMASTEEAIDALVVRTIYFFPLIAYNEMQLYSCQTSFRCTLKSSTCLIFFIFNRKCTTTKSQNPTTSECRLPRQGHLPERSRYWVWAFPLTLHIPPCWCSSLTFAWYWLRLWSGLSGSLLCHAS